MTITEDYVLNLLWAYLQSISESYKRRCNLEQIIWVESAWQVQTAYYQHATHTMAGGTLSAVNV